MNAASSSGYFPPGDKEKKGGAVKQRGVGEGVGGEAGGHSCFTSPSLKNITPKGQCSLEGKEKGTVFLCVDSSEAHP